MQTANALELGIDALRPETMPATLLRTYRVGEAGVIDGVVVRVGSRDNTIPVWLKDAEGTIHKCEAGSAVALELVRQYLGKPIRVSGQGDWQRGEDGWSMEKFEISSWEPLDDTPIAEMLNAARRVDGNGWNDVDDPIKEHLNLRESD